VKLFNHLVEAQIQSAMARGDFDALPGRGKPLPEDDLASLPERERMQARLARSAGAVPEEVVLLREIEELETRMKEQPDSPEMVNWKRALRDKQLRLDILFEYGGRHVLVGARRPR